MKYRKLGNTGLLVSEICMGTMTFGDSPWRLGGVGQEQADRMVRACLDAGVNFFDTADVYSRGSSETILGRALGAERQRVVLATKVRGVMDPADRNAAGLSRRHIRAAAEASLRRLGTDWIDLYQVHGWDALTPLEETLSVLDDLVREGKVRYIGFSNYAAWQAALSLGISRARGWTAFVSAQMYYSLICRDIEQEIVPLCRHESIALLPWSPLAGGLLSGKYSRGAPPPQGSRFADTGNSFPTRDLERAYRIVEAADAVARANALTLPQAAIAWLLAQPGVTSVIIGARAEEQLRENLAAAEMTIDESGMRTLEEISAIPAAYPRWMIAFQAGERKEPSAR